MTPKAWTSTGILAAFMAAVLVLGVLSLRASRRRAAGQPAGGGIAEWSVGGRSMGTLLIWVLMAGESYTSFSYLGAAGWGFDFGAPILYLVAYLGCGYAVGYLVGPMLWSYARDHGCLTITDMVAHRYGSRALGAATAVFATVFLLPYIQLQITGMGVVVSTVSYGAISLNWGYAVAFLVTTAFVVVSGLRGSAWVSMLKDILVIITLLVIAIWLPAHYFGFGHSAGYGELLHRMVESKADWLTLPGHDSGGLGEGWFASTTVLSALTITVFPTTVAGYLGAKNGGTLRRNAVFLPFYQVLLFIPMLLGMAALFAVPHLKDSNLALFTMVIDALPAWLVGVTGVAAALSSIVPMAVFMLVIGTMWGRSVLGTGRLAPRQKALSQLVVVMAGAVALLFTYLSPTTLVRLSVVSYEGMAQLVPVLLGGLLWKGMTKAGAVAGLAAGTALMLALVLSGHDPLWGCNAGLPALAVNAAVNLAVSRSGAFSREVTRH